MTTSNPDNSTKRGRHKSPEKRQLILAAASDLFVTYGFDGISMDKVAEKAGVSKQTVYSHFGNKEELFKFCIEVRCPLVDLSANLQKSDTPLREVLLTVGGQLLKLLISKDGVNIKRVCMNGAERQPEVSTIFFNAGPKNLANQLTTFFEMKTSSKELAIHNSHFAAWQFMNIIQGEFTLRANLGIPGKFKKSEMDDYLNSCVDLFLKAYTP
jgi:TetR/AcrR family transcriptional repressor of mexJK operon